MMILKSGCCLIVGLFICCVYRAAGQAVIELPVDPATKQVPYTLRGHNTEASNEAVWYISPSATEVISRLRPGVFRWPGGNTANNYDWKAHVKDNRQLTIAVLQQVSARYGTKPQIVVNYGTGSAADAAELVRFCNSTSDWYRQQREKMLLGDSTRLDVQMWEIGNENADAWAFARSWLGYQENIFYRSGEPSRHLTRKSIDSLYYYGGSFDRSGWVRVVGGLDKITAVLGDVKVYQHPVTGDTIRVKYPKLDTKNQDGIHVYHTPNFDRNWANVTASMQQLYDSISQPHNKLELSDFTFTDSVVIIHPEVPIEGGSVILIEYKSVGHDGAFAFRDSIKAADPNVMVGYNVDVENLETDATFRLDFARHPPDFMIKHPYPSVTVQAAYKGLRTEAVFQAERTATNLVQEQVRWDGRQIA